MEPASLQNRIAAARERLDAHVREIVAWHFDPASGCPFWLDHAARLGWDPRREVQCYDDLDKFPPFQDEWLRGGPVRRWVPRALAGRPVTTFETGGTTGIPKSRVNIEDYRTDYELFSETLSDHYFPKGGDWLMLGPSGPRRLRLAIEHLAQHRGGISFGVDLDPRWVTKLIKTGRMDLMHEYKEHVIQQGLTILRAHPNIRCLFTTPKLLEALCEKISLVKAGIPGVFGGGTSMTAQFYRFACEELLEGGADWWKPDPNSIDGRKRAKIDFVPTYGNTLMGLATHKPFAPADRYSVIYHPPLPRAVIEVVDPSSTEQPQAWHIAPNGQTRGVRHRVVEYGQVGRVRLTTLTREFFMPRFLERDEAVRHPPCEAYPWDGAGDVRPFSGFATPLIEGVY
ncbi:MAG: hypothetical protein HZB38_00945 [Planctomycetes bacterium]|nr:hypothetical protein [Planctomycetota bacterium]